MVGRPKKERPQPAPLTDDRSDQLRQEAIGKRLCALRERKDWSHRDLALLARVSPNTIASIERGDCDPRVSTMKRIADALACSAAYLTFGNG